MLGSSMAQPAPAGLSGVQIVKPGDPSFEGRVGSLFRGPTSGVVQQLQRHAVVLVNQSDETIVGYGVTWRYQEFGAKQNVQHWGRDPIAPGQARFVSMSAIVGPKEHTPKFLEFVDQRAAKTLSVVGGWADPVPSLDWVQFESATFEGPDTQGAFAVLMARADAPHAFADEVLGQKDVGAFLEDAAAHDKRVSRRRDPAAHFRWLQARTFLEAHGDGQDVSTKARELKAQKFAKPVRKGGVQ